MNYYHQKYKKIYVICGAYYKTGGTEALHQLVYHINETGGNAFIVYIRIREGLPLCNPAFTDYVKDNCLTEDDIEDEEDNLIIIPEGYPQYHNRYKKAVRMLWWLSVENFEGIYGFRDEEIDKMHREFKETVTMHLVQSEYARDYLLKKGVKSEKIMHLADYINSSYLEDLRTADDAQREDIILYNPRKGAESVNNIMKAAGDLKFVAIENMSNEEVKALMHRAKVYMDFGNHPGKDRIPREAAMCSCIVITGRHGAAAFKEDICIPDEYRMDENETTAQEITQKLREVLADYSEKRKDFDKYRLLIASEKAEFVADIKKIFFSLDIKEEDYKRISDKRILIVIVSYNQAHLMEENIKSIRATLPKDSYKIVVTDNASTDGVRDYLKKQEDILLILNDENKGFSPACNQAVNATKGTEYEDCDVFLLNNDTRLAPNSLFFLMEALYSDSEVGAVGAISNYAGNRQQIDIEFDRAEQYIIFSQVINIPGDNVTEERVRLSGFAMLIRRKLWDAIGGFDEDFAPGYFEDDALSMEILKRGFRLKLVKNSFIYHAGSQSFSKTDDYGTLLNDHRQLFVDKYGFDIINNAYANETVLLKLPYAPEDSFRVLETGCGLGANLKLIRGKFKNAETVGIESDENLCAIAKQTESVFSSMEEVKAFMGEEKFNVLLVDPDIVSTMSREEKEYLVGLCRTDAILIQKNAGYESFPFEEVRLVVWDMDDTFWKGTLSEEEVTLIPENIELVKELTNNGIINSISSKNDEEPVLRELDRAGIRDLFVFNNINWNDKGSQLKEKIKRMGLRAENVLLIDDNIRNLEEARFAAKELKTATPDIIPYLINYVLKLTGTDLSHNRLDQYKLLEKKTEAMDVSVSKEDFLYESHISVTINKNCMEELERIHEMVLRTNQLNFTKNRDNKELLSRLLTNDWNESGYVRVRDRFGDYGIVGFYCYNRREKKMEHFLFSCRILGMGVEQYIYNMLGCPDFEIKTPVAASLEKNVTTPWITENTDAEITEDRIKDSRVRILLKGPCDMSAIEPYLTGGNITTEFNYINDEGFVTTGQNHTMHIWESMNLSRKEIDDIVNEVPFIIEGDFETKLFSEEYHIICLSLLQDLSAGLYRNKDTGAYISFSSKNFDLTSPEFRSRFINKQIQGHDFDFTEEIIDRFSERWEFVGTTPIELLLRNLDFIYDNVKGDPIFILLLGSEKDYEGYNEEFAGLAEIYREVNPIIKAFAEDHDRVKVIDPTEFIHSQDDFEDCINHFARNVYYEISGKVCDHINEAVENIARKQGRIKYADTFEKIDVPKDFYRAETRSGFYVDEMTKKIWAVELDLIKQFDSVCKKYGLTYYMDNGTLLGAVRHEGFIPWDNDVDLVMMRPDFERLREIADREFMAPYGFQVSEEVEGMVYLNSFGRLRNANTSAIEFYDAPRARNQGIFIDVFVFDDAGGDGNDSETKYYTKLELWMACTNPELLKELAANGQTNLNKGSVDAVIELPVMERVEMYEKFCLDNFGISSDIKVLQDHTPPMPRSYFDGITYLPFEGLKLPAPIKYDSVLRARYGNYMKPVRGSSQHEDIEMDPMHPYYMKLWQHNS
ncbi:MAG: HAD-IIIC family phosphatase [Lachnospiraceae bacterium]|nr:HAD-IIIC family phosphatase [Lachnospiraceae bacterium]